MSRVLIVERVASVREALGFVLELEGHEVMLARDGAAALAAAAAWRPDVVLVDADLPDMPLSSLCSALQTAAGCAALVVTSMRPVGCVPVGTCPGAAFLAKPFTATELLDVMAA